MVIIQREFLRANTTTANEVNEEKEQRMRRSI